MTGPGRPAEREPTDDGGSSRGRETAREAVIVPPASSANGGAEPTTAAVATMAALPGRRGAGRRARLAEAFVALEGRDFRYLTFSTFVNGFAQWAQQIGLFWLIFELTGSSVLLGTLAAVRGGVGLVLGPLAGYLSDRYNRRTIMVLITAAGAAQSGVLAAVVLAGQIEVWHIFVFALLEGGEQALNGPARQAIVFDVTDEQTLPNAVTLNSISQNVSRVAGPPLAGAMIGFIGLASPFVFVLATRSLATALTMMIGRTRQEPMTRGRSALLDVWEGFKYSLGDRTMLGLMLVNALPALFVYPYLNFLPVVASDVLHRGAEGYGFLASMIGWGSIVGLVLLAFLANVRRRGVLMVLSFVIYTALIMAFAWSDTYWLSLTLLAIAGIVHAPAMALNHILVLLVVRPEMRGRTLAVMQMTFSLQPLGALPMGVLIAAKGPSVGISSFVAFTGLALLFLLVFSRSLRRLQ